MKSKNAWDQELYGPTGSNGLAPVETPNAWNDALTPRTQPETYNGLNAANIWTQPEKKPMGPGAQFAVSALDALSAGLDPEKHHYAMQERQMSAQASEQQAAQKLFGMGEMAHQLSLLPMEQREQAFMQMAPGYGLTQEELAQYEPDDISDSALQGAMRAAAGVGFQPPQAQAPDLGEGMRWNAQTGQAEVLPGYLDAQQAIDAIEAPAQMSPYQRAQIDMRQQELDWKQSEEYLAQQERLRQAGHSSSAANRVLGPGSALVDANGNVIHNQPSNAKIVTVGGVPHMVINGEAIPVSDAETVGTNRAIAKTIETEEQSRLQALQELPSEELNADMFVSRLDTALSHPGLEDSYGLRAILPAIPGTARADYESFLASINSGAFLQTISSVPSLTPVSDNDVKMVTGAVSRLQQQNISVGEARAALNELRLYIDGKLEIARRRAAGTQDGYGGAPRLKPLEEMSDEELAAYEASLMGDQ